MTTRRYRDQAGPRRLTTGQVTIRDAAVEGGPRTVEGIAVPYGQTTRDEAGRLERFIRGAFGNAIARWSSRDDGAAMPILDRHNGSVIGVVRELVDEPAGLRFRGELLDVPEAHAWARRVEAGVNGISIEFEAEPGGTRARGRDGIDILRATLYAIAGSHAPAYDGARVALRQRQPAPPVAIGGSGDMRYSERIRARLDTLRSERQAIHTIAEAEGRALTDDELERLESIDGAIPNLEATYTRAVDEEGRRTAEGGALDRAAGSSTTQAGGSAGASSTAGAPQIYGGPGAFLRDRALARRGNTTAQQRLDRALADVTTADAAGLIPTSITGPVLGGFATRRPLVESARLVSIGEAGMTVTRPFLTGGDVDEQVTEKTEVTSTAMTITPVDFDLKTYAGGVDVSWQLIERSSPAALDAIFRRLANRYARRTEIVAATTFAAAVVDTQAIATLDGAGIIAALIAAAGDIASDEDVDTFPDTIWMSLGGWAKLASVVDGNGRPLFPLGGSGISLGLGGGDQVTLRPVIVPRLAANTTIVGASEFLERYELPGSPVEFRSIDATRLGTDVSVAGLFALGVVDEDAFVELTYPA